MEVFKVFATMTLMDAISKPLRLIDTNLKRTDKTAVGLGATLGRLAASWSKVALAGAVFLTFLAGAALSTTGTEKALAELASVGVRDFAALDLAALKASNHIKGVTKASFLTAAYDIKSGIASLSDEGVAGFTALAAKTAQATKATVEQMTSLFATSYGLYKSAYANLTDFQFGEMFAAGLAASVQQFKTTGERMQMAIQNIGASATLAGVPLQEQLAVLGRLQDSMEAPVAGTAYKAFFRTATKGFQDLGVSAVDAGGKLRSLPDLLGDLERKFGALEQSELDRIVKAFGDEGGMAVMNLYGKSEVLRKNILDVGAAMQRGVSYVDDMRAAMNAGLGPSLILLGQRFMNLLEIVGAIFAPMIADLAGLLGLLVLGLQKLAASRTGRFFLMLAGAVSTVVTGVTGLAIAAALLKPVLATAGGAVAAVSWPVWALAAAVAGLYLAWRNNLFGMRDVLGGWWRKVSLTFRAVLEVFRSLAGGVGVIRGELAEKIEAAGLTGLVSTVARIVYRIQSYLSGLWAGISGPLSEAFGVLATTLTPIMSGFGTLFQFLGRLTGLLSGAAEATQAGTWAGFGKVVGLVLGQILKTAVDTLSMFLSLLTGIGSALGALIYLIYASGAAVVEAVKSSVAWIGEMSRAVWSGLTGVWEMVLGFFSGKSLAEVGLALLRTLGEGIIAGAGEALGALAGVLGKLRNLLPFSDAKEGPLSTLTKSGLAIPGTLAKGMAEGEMVLRNAAENVLAAVTDAGLGVCPAPAGTPAAPQSVPAISSRREGTDSGRREIRLTIGKVVLPNVQAPMDFVREIQDLVDEYGGAYAG